MLAAKFNGVLLAEDGFALEFGSTRVNVQINEFGEDPDGNPRTIVNIWAPVARDVSPSNEFFKWAATEAQGYRFGSTAVLELENGRCLVVYSETLLGDFLDTEELHASVALVALTADDLDDVVRTRFGGKRYVDA